MNLLLAILNLGLTALNLAFDSRANHIAAAVSAFAAGWIFSYLFWQRWFA